MANELDHALIVGIDEYESFAPLFGAVNDVNHFEAWLVSPTGGDVPPGNVNKIVSARIAGEPRRDQIENLLVPFIGRYIDNGYPIGRRLYIFLAGHGIDAGTLEDCGLVMADANQYTNDRTLPGRLLATAFKRSNAFNEIVLFMDCCREVVMPSAPGDLPVLANLPTVDDSGARMLHGLATTWRRTAGEREFPNPNGRGTSVQGIFTYALLDGLQRSGDEDGIVTASGLRNYVKQYMLHLTGSQQNPDIDVTPEEIVICEPGVGSTTVHVKLAAGASDFDVRDGANYFALTDAPRVDNGDGTWTLALRPGAYLFGRPAGNELGAYVSTQDCNVVGKDFVVEL